MDAFTLGQEAAKLGGHEKQAFIGKALQAGAKLAPKALKFGLPAAGGALAGKDLLSGATGGWQSNTTGDLGWHRQRMQGLDQGAGYRGWFNPNAWGATLGSPLKSLAATFHGGEGPAYVSPTPAPAQSRLDPATGRFEVPAQSLEPIWSPKTQYQFGQFDQFRDQASDLSARRKALAQQHQQQLAAMQGGSYLGGFRDRSQVEKAMALEDAFRAQSGELDKRIAAATKQRDAFGQQLRDLGIDPEHRRLFSLGQEAAQAPPLAYDYTYYTD